MASWMRARAWAAAALLLVAVPVLWDPGTLRVATGKWALLSVGALVAVLRPWRRPKVGTLALVWLAWGLLGLAWAPSVRAGVEALLGQALGLSVFFWAVRDRVQVLAGAVVGWGLVVVVGLWDLLAGAGDPSGSLGNPNYLASYAAAGLPLAAVSGRWALRREWPRQELGFLLLVGLCGLGLSALVLVWSTGSRAAASAAALGLAVLGAFRWRRWGTAALLALVVAGGVLGATRWRSGVRSRLFLKRITLRLVAEHPLRGHGPGAFPFAFPEAQAKMLAERPGDRGLWTNARHAHDDLLELLLEQGLVGVVLLAILGLGAWHRRGGRLDAWSAAAAGGLVALGVTSLAEAIFRQPAHLALGAALAGLVFAGDRSGAGDSGEEWESAALGRWPAQAPWAVFVLLVLGAVVWFGASHVAERRVASALGTARTSSRAELLGRVASWAPRPGRVRFYRGLALLEAGRAQDALRELDRARGDFRDLALELAVGNALFALGKYREAARQFERVCWLHPRFVAGYHNWALALERAGDEERAARIREREHSLWPGLRRVGNRIVAPRPGW